MDNIFLQFAVVLSAASILGLIALKLKLPIIVSYLLAGVALSVLSVVDTTNSLVLNILPEIGIAFVLFLIGVELDLKEIRSLGIPVAVSAIGQVTLSMALGFWLAGLFGFGVRESLLLGLGLAFSSTIVVIKMLTDKQDLTSLYGKLSIGISLVEDLIAVIALMVVSVGNSFLTLGFQTSLPLATLILKGALLFVLTFVLSKYVLQKLFDSVAKSTELLFLTSITWCFAFTSLAVLAGFSIEIGAFLAGVALASSPYHLQIQGKIKPLRDFFLTLFFIYLGSLVKIGYIIEGLPVIIIFTAVAVAAKPFIYMVLLGLFGFKRHTVFQTSLNLSQISEFSLIVLIVGAKFGGVSPIAISVMASVAVISIITSSILISQSWRIYRLVSPIMKIFQRKTKLHFMESGEIGELDGAVIVIGVHRVGGPIIEYLKKADIPFLAIDFNPHVVKELVDKGMNAIYGDIGDPEFLDNLHLEKSKLIISTAASMTDNETLLSECKRRGSAAVIMVRAEDKIHGEALKALGADYIITPERVSGAYLVHQLKDHWPRVVFSGLD